MHCAYYSQAGHRALKCFRTDGDHSITVDVRSMIRFKLFYSYHKMYTLYIIQLSPEGEVNSGGYIPRREASRYISTTFQRP